MLQPILVVLFFVNNIYATEYGRTMASPGNGEMIPLDITLTNNTMLVYPGQPNPPQACFKQSLNFHDFEKHLVAIKIVDKGVCWIKKTTESYEEIHEVLESIKAGESSVVNQVTEEWTVPDKEVIPKLLEATVGQRIANFCSGYKVYIMQDGHLVKKTDEVSKRKAASIARSGDCVNCYKCKVKTRG